MNAYADFVCRRRGLLGLAIVALTALAVGGLTRLRLDEDDVHRVASKKAASVQRLNKEWVRADRVVKAVTEFQEVRGMAQSRSLVE